MKVFVWVLIAFILFVIANKIFTEKKYSYSPCANSVPPYISPKTKSYEDSLIKYFDPLEHDLIIKYLSLYEQDTGITNINSFERFMRESRVIAISTQKSFQKKLADPKSGAYLSCMDINKPSFKWFNLLCRSFIIVPINTSFTCSYAIWIDFDRLAKLTILTPENTDDLFIKELEKHCDIKRMQDGTRALNPLSMKPYLGFFREAEAKNRRLSNTYN